MIPCSILHTQNPFSTKESCKGPDSVHCPLHRGPLPCHSMPFWINVPVQEITLAPYKSRHGWQQPRHSTLQGVTVYCQAVSFFHFSCLSLSSEIGVPDGAVGDPGSKIDKKDVACNCSNSCITSIKRPGLQRCLALFPSSFVLHQYGSLCC